MTSKGRIPWCCLRVCACACACAITSAWGLSGCDQEPPAPELGGQQQQPQQQAMPEIPTGPQGAIAANRSDLSISAGDVATEQQPPPLPRGWKGTGVLEKTAIKLPRRAPRWARVAVEVTERAGERFLIATGHARGIGNPALARSTAEARARAAMARWLGVGVGVGHAPLQSTRPIAHWANKRLAIARVEMPIAADVLAPTATR